MQTDAEILVVDDTPANLKVVTQTLSSAGYRVAIATNGERALKQLQQTTPSLILLDIKMPGMDGFETCQRIKNNPNLCHIPIIFLTALADTDSTLKGFELGAVDYISKPFREPELLARVKTHLQLQQITQNLEQKVEERTQALTTAMTERQRYQLQLIQHEKMSTLGNLVAGIGHEINNPIGFVGGNISILKDYFDVLATYIQLYDQVYPSPNDVLVNTRQALEVDYVLKDIKVVLESMTSGCDRIQEISKSLRIFSRVDTASKLDTNLHEGLDSTLHILQYRLKANNHRPVIQIVKDYDPLPDINCFPGQLNQALMNILANAIDMFDEMAENAVHAGLDVTPQVIKLQTRRLENLEIEATEWVEIRITDNGKGMTDAVCSQIFARDFTTKAVGKGTGLGLAIAHQVIVENHGGTLTVHSKLNQGTEFCIRLPVKG